RLTPLLALHQAHLAELRRAAPAKSLAKAPVFAITVPARAPKALAAVLERTQALREECNASAVRAESGSFARLLAGVGAGLAQRLALLEAPVRSAG
ncbi:MAG: hypothetical protein ABI873_13740, partial [Marmoricola sp.]